MNLKNGVNESEESCKGIFISGVLLCSPSTVEMASLIPVPSFETTHQNLPLPDTLIFISRRQ